MTHQKQCRTASIKLVSIHNRKSLEKEKEKDMDVSVLVFQTYINLLIAASKTTKPLTKKTLPTLLSNNSHVFLLLYFPFLFELKSSCTLLNPRIH